MGKGHMPVTEDETSYCVYILFCADDSLYTGMTNDLARRLAEHRAGRGAQWTQRRLPVEVVFSLNGLSYRTACEVERYIKTLPRAKKEALIARDPRILALVEKRIVQ
jgi:predicted GIY-YIG superfamily endonuclease